MGMVKFPVFPEILSLKTPVYGFDEFVYVAMQRPGFTGY